MEKHKEIVQKFADFYKKNIDLNYTLSDQQYASLPICILDCIYSLRAQYISTTVPVIDKYAKAFLEGNKFDKSHTINDFMTNIEKSESFNVFARDILNNNQKTGGRNKTEVCYELARKLQALGIETMQDFKNFKSEEILEIIILSAKGIGKAGLNYLFMLTGDDNRCKPDVHIHRCIKDASGIDVSDDECQIIFKETVELLNKDYPNLTMRKLDYAIWEVYQIKA